MATRREARRRSIRQVLVLVTIAAVIIAVVVAIQSWQRNRPDPEPADTTLTATVGEHEAQVAPYMLAQIGGDTVEHTPTRVEVGPEETLTIALPEHVYDHDWRAVLIYENPAYNQEIIHGANEATSVDVPGSAVGGAVDENGEKAGADAAPSPLLVVEVQSVLIGHDDQGEEVPVTTVWSVATAAAGNEDDAAGQP